MMAFKFNATTSLLSALGVALVYLAASSQAEAREITVNLSRGSFGPVQIQANAGDGIRFDNSSKLMHTVTVIGRDDVLGNQPVKPNESFVFRVSSGLSPGTYVLNCGLHPGMQAELVVKG